MPLSDLLAAAALLLILGAASAAMWGVVYAVFRGILWWIGSERKLKCGSGAPTAAVMCQLYLWHYGPHAGPWEVGEDKRRQRRRRWSSESLWYEMIPIALGGSDDANTGTAAQGGTPRLGLVRGATGGTVRRASSDGPAMDLRRTPGAEGHPDPPRVLEGGADPPTDRHRW